MLLNYFHNRYFCHDTNKSSSIISREIHWDTIEAEDPVTPDGKVQVWKLRRQQDLHNTRCRFDFCKHQWTETGPVLQELILLLLLLMHFPVQPLHPWSQHSKRLLESNWCWWRLCCSSIPWIRIRCCFLHFATTVAWSHSISPQVAATVDISPSTFDGSVSVTEVVTEHPFASLMMYAEVPAFTLQKAPVPL